jgi:hypothetical protein
MLKLTEKPLYVFLLIVINASIRNWETEGPDYRLHQYATADNVFVGIASILQTAYLVRWLSMEEDDECEMSKL